MSNTSAEARAALERSLGTLVEDRPKKEYLRTDAGRGKKTEGCLELDALPVLKVVPKAVSQTQLSAPSCKARRAALALWQKARTILALLGTEPAAPAALHRIALAPEETRSWRRGESKHDTGKERDYSEEEFCKHAVMLRDKQIKWTEYDAKYKEGEVRVPAATFRRYIYGRYKDKLEARLAGGGALKKGAAARHADRRPCCTIGCAVCCAYRAVSHLLCYAFCCAIHRAVSRTFSCAVCCAIHRAASSTICCTVWYAFCRTIGCAFCCAICCTFGSAIAVCAVCCSVLCYGHRSRGSEEGSGGSKL